MHASIRFFFLVLFLLGSLTPVTRAQFIGDYALTPPAGSVITSNSTAGNWNFSLVTTGSATGSLDTSLAPDSFTLQSTATGSGNSITDTLNFLSVSQAGTISFNYNSALNAGGIAFGTDFSYSNSRNGLLDLASTADSFMSSVLPGDTLSFSTTATGGVLFGLGGPTSTQAEALVTISNFSFTPASVPEPANYAVASGIVTLLIAIFRRRQI
jgi:hypothetical protein